MEDGDKEQVKNVEVERTEILILKEISKLKYYLDGADELIRGNDVEEMKTTVKQTSKSTSKLTELISQLENLELTIAFH